MPSQVRKGLAQLLCTRQSEQHHSPCFIAPFAEIDATTDAASHARSAARSPYSRQRKRRLATARQGRSRAWPETTRASRTRRPKARARGRTRRSQRVAMKSPRTFAIGPRQNPKSARTSPPGDIGTPTLSSYPGTVSSSATPAAARPPFAQRRCAPPSLRRGRAACAHGHQQPALSRALRAPARALRFAS